MIEITGQVNEILSDEIKLFIENSGTDPKLKNEFQSVEAAIFTGKLEEEHLPVFSYFLETLLASGDIRKKYGYREELLILNLYKATPWGIERINNLNDINRTLTALQDHNIDDISISLILPGIYGLNITTDKCRVTFEINQFGIAPDKIEFAI